MKKLEERKEGADFVAQLSELLHVGALLEVLKRKSGCDKVFVQVEYEGVNYFLQKLLKSEELFIEEEFNCSVLEINAEHCIFKGL
ncbi:MAG: hypothetical protein EA362_07520 [Saprospirales bacterium]|nr:MAG: hypothetical protein EA362_07520 [Saprospirales bacterium]